MAGGPALDYDRLAATYAGNRQARGELVRRIAARAALGPASDVLELGCGTGNHVIALAAATGCRATGIDRSSGMLAHALASARSVRFVQAAAERLPFAADRFDLAFSVDVIHHVTGRDRFFAEAHRVLKPGGRLCIATHSAALLRQSMVMARYFPEAVARDVLRYPTIEQMQALMAATGLAGIEQEVVEMPAVVSDAAPYAAKAYSSLHLIDEVTFRRGLHRLVEDLKAGPITGTRRYLLLWGVKPV